LIAHGGVVYFEPSQGAPLACLDVHTKVLFVFTTCFEASVLCSWKIVLPVLLIRLDVLNEHLAAQILVWFPLATLVAGVGFVHLPRQPGQAESTAVVSIYRSVRYGGRPRPSGLNAVGRRENPPISTGEGS